MVSDVTDGPSAKNVTVGFKDIPIREEFLTAEQILERAGLDPLEYELRFPNTGEQISFERVLKIKDGMKLDAVIKSR
ncbi:hypothetical protein NTE_02204 [Candidatus Nitrososphaera evergladensis SR1]|uniref:Uncharacterized protein n=1 Tax=Candidatus Nitrososphaera evergladensis SR1 TaxID=1459636 RepID=A0A075MT19_9ARCH|nr:hypothetical protein [Candidatus Nitrososphaera evergladensis]AIF84258.1 hypothetical protein NTE_02204 [Candidatus Nitrososphaera evergladensis SR1]